MAWTRQPPYPAQLDPYWLSRGLAYVFVGNKLFATKYGSRPSRSMVGGPKNVGGYNGVAQGFGTSYGLGTTDHIQGPDLALSTGFRSIVSHFLADTVGGGNLGRIFQSSAGTGADAAEAMFMSTGRMSYSRFAAAQNQWTIGPVIPLDTPYSVGFTHDQRSASTPLSYALGKPDSTAVVTAPGGTYSTGTYTPAWGNRPSDNARGWVGTIGITLIFDHPDKGLTDAEHLALYLNPYQVFAPMVRRVFYGETAGSGVTGSIVATNANDTGAFVGSTTVIGSIARTNANDTAALAGSTTVLGAVASTNANDTASFAGSVGSSVTGSIAVTNAGDTAAFAGSTTVVGAVEGTNANDSAALSGSTTIVGALAATNANDSASFSGVAGAVTGSIDATNANDSANFVGDAGAPVVTNAPRSGVGPRRRGYIVNGKKRWLTEEELAIVVAHELQDVSRDDVKVVKNGKIKPVPKEVWAEVSQMVAKLEKLGEAAPIEDNDEEEILLMYA